MQRKLDKNRLNTLNRRLFFFLKIFVIIIGFIFIVKSIYYGLIVYSQTPEQEMIYVSQECSHLYPKDINCATDTYPFVIDSYNKRVSILKSSLFIGFGLPLIFFGGIGLFNYLFPQTKKKNQE